MKLQNHVPHFTHALVNQEPLKSHSRAPSREVSRNARALGVFHLENKTNVEYRMRGKIQGQLKENEPAKVCRGTHVEVFFSEISDEINSITMNETQREGKHNTAQHKSLTNYST